MLTRSCNSAAAGILVKRQSRFAAPHGFANWLDGLLFLQLQKSRLAPSQKNSMTLKVKLLAAGKIPSETERRPVMRLMSYTQDDQSASHLPNAFFHHEGRSY